MHQHIFETIFRLLPSIIGSSEWRFTSLQFMEMLISFCKDLVPGITHGLNEKCCDPNFTTTLEKYQDTQFHLDSENLMRKVFTMLKQYPVAESLLKSRTDETMIGLMELARTLVKANNHLSLNKNCGLDVAETDPRLCGGALPTCFLTGNIVTETCIINHIFQDFLFQPRTIRTPSDLKAGSRLQNIPPKCKTTASRACAFKLLIDLARTSPHNRRDLVLLNTPNHKHSDRGFWNYAPNNMRQSPTQYVGLQNLGATCYMNSLMQQLFMIPEFRYGILVQPTDDKSEKDREQNLMYQLQCIFGYLQESQQKFFDAQGFCAAYKDYDGNPMHHAVQMDVNEFFNVLFDKLEALIRGTRHEKMLDYTFGGKIINQLICVDCPHRSERLENYYILSLEVKNKRSVKESLELYVEGEMLEGDNKYYCQKCKKKVAALKR